MQALAGRVLQRPWLVNGSVDGGFRLLVADLVANGMLCEVGEIGQLQQLWGRIILARGYDGGADGVAKHAHLQDVPAMGGAQYRRSGDAAGLQELELAACHNLVERLDGVVQQRLVARTRASLSKVAKS